MASNLQIFVVAVPVLVILGRDSSAFFVRCAVVWMNDLCVVAFIFGNLIYRVHKKADQSENDGRSITRQAMSQYRRSVAGSSMLEIKSVLHDESLMNLRSLAEPPQPRQDSEESLKSQRNGITAVSGNSSSTVTVPRTSKLSDGKKDPSTESRSSDSDACSGETE